MLKILKQAIREGIVTNSFPDVVTIPPDGFRGKPLIDFARCTACDKCAGSCPTGAIAVEQVTGADHRVLKLDYGQCIFCGECEAACPDTIQITKEFQLATANRANLVSRASYKPLPNGYYEFAEVLSDSTPVPQSIEDIGAELRKNIHEIFGRSLHIREVDAGSCNGCEVEITALNNPIYDIERFGLHFVASPRHADMLLVTGPVTRNMEIALKQTYDATPHPKLVVAVGACGISGGIFGQTFASVGGVDKVVPVDMYIPGCPPRPEALLQGILLAIGQISGKR